MAARQLRFLGVLCLQHVTDAVQQLDVALMWVLLQSRDERPGHGARGFGSDGRVGATQKSDLQQSFRGDISVSKTYEV
jgi:hypothetical protein